MAMMRSPLRRASIAYLALTLALAPAPALAAEPPEPADDAAPEPDDDAEAADDSPPAAAQGPVETIEYTDGHRIKGQFIEVVPEDSITLVSAATGRTVRVPWSQIARYTRDGAWVGDTEPRRERPTSSGYGPRVHIDAPGDVALYQILGEGTAVGRDVVIAWMHYRPVCRAPCNDTVDVSTGAKFFVGGDKYTGSRRLNLGDKRGNLTLQVKPGRKSVMISGTVLMGLGVSSIALGVGVGYIRKVEAENPGYDTMGTPLPATTPDYRLPRALVILGALGMAGGLVMMILGRTRVRMREGGIGLVRPLRFG